MSQNSLQTQCPKCKTRFRVSDEQLAVANGKVRCGHCMEIFNAREHRIPAAGQAGKPAPQTSAREPVRPAVPDSGEDDDLIFADNPEEDAAEGHYAGTLRLPEEELSESFLSLDRDPDPVFRDAETETFDDDAEPREPVDESWAEAMLREHENTSEEPASPQPQVPQQSPPQQPPRQQAPQTSSQKAGARSPAPDEKTRHEQPQQPLSLTAVPEDRKTRIHTGAAPGRRATADTGAAAEPAPQQPQPQEDPDTPPIRATVPFGDLRREPVSVEYVRRSRHRTWFWGLIVVILLATLVAQVAWFQFDRLSAIPELRPFYEKACDLAGCQLRPLLDVSAIQSRRLVVRTNPDDRSQLLVEAVIINRAAFEQPFPAIALTFSNLDGDVVAQSIFTPEEYLAGDARELTSMPVNTPVRIAIAIRDPGRDAVNYNLDFRPHPP